MQNPHALIQMVVAEPWSYYERQEAYARGREWCAAAMEVRKVTRNGEAFWVRPTDHDYATANTLWWALWGATCAEQALYNEGLL